MFFQRNRPHTLSRVTLKSDYVRRMLIDSAGEPRLSEEPGASGSDKIQKMCGLVQGVLSGIQRPHGPSHLCRCYYSANVLIASASMCLWLGDHFHLPLTRSPAAEGAALAAGAA